jgi:hypothetical protein
LRAGGDLERHGRRARRFLTTHQAEPIRQVEEAIPFDRVLEVDVRFALELDGALLGLVVMGLRRRDAVVDVRMQVLVDEALDPVRQL